MCSANIVDFLAEKLFSFSSKMRDDSFQHFGTSFLVNGSNSNAQQWDPLKAVTVLKGNALYFEDNNQSYQNAFLNQMLSMLNSNHSLKFYENFERPEYLFARTKNGLFSPHLLNLINNLNSYHSKNTLTEMSLLPSNSIFGNISNFSESEVKQNSKVNFVKKSTCNLPVNRLVKENSEASSDIKKNCLPISKLKMSVNISKFPTKTESTSVKCNVSTSVKLNLKLANRKTKQMNKRSKKRRRRQKKSQHSVGDSVTLSDGGSVSNSKSPHSSRVCFIAENTDFGCEISFQSNIQMPSCVSSFVVPVESDSDDDSEWDTYDENDLSNPNSLISDREVHSSSDSSPIKSKSTESESYIPKIKVASSIVSFVVPVSDSSDDDDSEWDSCEPDSFTETPNFEFTGLFLANLCSPQIVSSTEDTSLTVTSEDEIDESLQLKKILLEANKKWDNLKQESYAKVKTAAKVTFAPDKELVEIFPVEFCERKGEWEVFATERMRFKRKINELEKVLSPCLHPDHRTKVFEKLMENEL